MRILVTGGTGYIGKPLVARLEKKHEVIAISRHGPASGDVSKYADVLQASRGCDRIYHLAANASHFATHEELRAANVAGTENVLKAALQNEIETVVYASSAAATAPNPTRYGLSKAAAERVVEKYARRLNVPTLRFPYVYDESKILKLASLPFLPAFTRPFQHHLAYRGSAVDALIKASGKKSGFYNVADRTPATDHELLQTVAAHTNQRIVKLPRGLIAAAEAVAYPMDVLSPILKFRPPVTREAIRNVFQDRSLDPKLAMKALRYKQVDTKTMFEKTLTAKWR